MSEVVVPVLCVDQLASIIHKSPASVRSDASRNPGSLPPICRLPGSKRLLWRLEDVQRWLASHVQQGADCFPHEPTQIESPVVRKRGRPRKVA